MVVEAVFENMDLKKKIFKELDGIVGEHTILCTNTSTLDIDEIGAVVKDSSRTMGMHFFSPANVMKLVENVKSKVRPFRATLHIYPLVLPALQSGYL
jgi:3-hydroxyacyl-CoA dehydrogenase